MKTKINYLLSPVNAKAVAYTTTILSIAFSVLGIFIYELWFLGIFGIVSFGLLMYLEKCKFSMNDNSVWAYATGAISCIFTIICFFFMLGRTFINIVL